MKQWQVLSFESNRGTGTWNHLNTDVSKVTSVGDILAQKINIILTLDCVH